MSGPRVLRATPYFFLPGRPLGWREMQYEPIGGMQTQTMLLTRALAGRLAQTVALPRRPGMPRWRAQPLPTDDRVRLVALPLPLPRIPSFGKGYAGLAGAWGASLAGYCVRHRGEHDIIHVHCSELPWCYLAAPAAARAARTPLVLTVHCSAIGTFAPQTSTEARLLRFAQAAEARAVRAAAAVIVLRHELRRRYLAAGLAEPDRVHVIGDAVAPVPAHPPNGDGTLRVGYVGRVSPEKGWQDLLAAFAWLTREHPALPARLVVVGDGNEMRALRHRVRHLGLSARVDVLGAVDQNHAQQLVSTMDIVAVPSRYEELGTTLLEAMAAGRAIVASRTGGITEAVADRSTALLVPPGDPHALGVALAELAYRPDLRASLGRNARRAAEPYDIATVAEQNLRVYHQVVRLGRIAH